MYVARGVFAGGISKSERHTFSTPTFSIRLVRNYQWANGGRIPALNGAEMVLGSPDAEFGAPKSGAVRVKMMSSCLPSGACHCKPGYLGDTCEQSLFLNDRQHVGGEFDGVGSHFGFSVDADGDTAIIGSNGNSPEEEFGGIATIWRQDENGAWQLEQRLRPSIESAYGRFGFSVSISGDFAAVGAQLMSLGGVQHVGSVFLFQRVQDNTWREIQHLEYPLPNARNFEEFGVDVVLDGQRLIVGSLGYGGHAFIFEPNVNAEWKMVAQLEPSVERPTDTQQSWYGLAVDLSGDYAVVGARTFDRVGTAFVFERQVDGTWKHVTELRSSSGRESVWWSTVETMGTILVGARLEDRVYVYTRLGGVWTESQVLSAGNQYDQFGYSLALKGPRALIGAPITNDGRKGSVYLYERLSGGQFQKVAMYSGAGDILLEEFGVSVGIGESLAVIGAWEEAVGGDGKAFIYNLDEGE